MARPFTLVPSSVALKRIQEFCSSCDKRYDLVVNIWEESFSIVAFEVLCYYQRVQSNFSFQSESLFEEEESFVAWKEEELRETKAILDTFTMATYSKVLLINIYQVPILACIIILGVKFDEKRFKWIMQCLCGDYSR